MATFRRIEWGSTAARAITQPAYSAPENRFRGPVCLRDSLCVLVHALRGEKTGIYLADRTKLAVCNNARIGRNRVLAGLTARGRCTMGWFYGFKLHLVINRKGQIMALKM